MHNFKKTAAATLALLLCVVLIFAGYTAPYFYGTTYPYQDAAVRDGLAGQLDTLICGSSHAYRAFIPEQLDEALGTNTYNIAYSMQTMQGRYFLLEKELSRNPVKTVILEVSYNALTRNRASEGPEGDIYELGRFRNPLERWRFFLSAIAPTEYGKLYYDTMDRSTTAWSALLRGETGLESTRGYLGLDPVDQSFPVDQRQSVLHSEALCVTQDEQDVYYFEKCLALCQEKGARVLLITTPMPEKTVLAYDALDTVRGWYVDYAQRYGCEFYDFNLLKTKNADYPADTAFFDKTHVSRYGAETFTADLIAVLQGKARGESTAELFYDSYADWEQALLAEET